MSEKKGKKIPVRKRKGEIAPWYPSDLMSDFDRLFDDFRFAFRDLFRPERRWAWPLRMPRVTMPEARAPCCDVMDTGKEYRVTAELPGIPNEKIDISVDRNGLEISAEAKTEAEKEKKGYMTRERSYSRFYRRMAFPEEVLPEKTEATYENGVLDVRVPKKTPTEIKKHKVKVK